MVGFLPEKVPLQVTLAKPKAGKRRGGFSMELLFFFHVFWDLVLDRTFLVFYRFLAPIGAPFPPISHHFDITFSRIGLALIFPVFSIDFGCVFGKPTCDFLQTVHV